MQTIREEVPPSTLDTTRIDDVRIAAVRALVSPAVLLEDLPVTPEVEALVEATRQSISDVLHARDDRLVAVVGPCSIHDAEAALDYARRLQPLARELAGELVVVMRVYFEKPRTTVGWKGYINDPRLDGSFRINEGLRKARELLLAISALGVPAGTEFLDLLSPQYQADLIAWGAIGARTTESQSHRQLASGLSCPVGFKNGTDGSLQVAADAVLAAAARHSFMGMTKMGVAAIFETRGNPDGHVILRGGGGGPNYDAAGVDTACAVLRKAALAERVLIDCSHANSAKQHRRQIEVAADIGARVAAGERRIVGVMVESHLQPGRQDLEPGEAPAYGVSITDACIGWDDTVPLLRSLASSVQARRRGAAAASDSTS